MVVRLALIINTNIKNPQTKYCPCLNYVMIYSKILTFGRPEFIAEKSTKR